MCINITQSNATDNPNTLTNNIFVQYSISSGDYSGVLKLAILTRCDPLLSLLMPLSPQKS